MKEKRQKLRSMCVEIERRICSRTTNKKGRQTYYRYGKKMDKKASNPCHDGSLYIHKKALGCKLLSRYIPIMAFLLLAAFQSLYAMMPEEDDYAEGVKAFQMGALQEAEVKFSKALVAGDRELETRAYLLGMTEKAPRALNPEVFKVIQAESEKDNITFKVIEGRLHLLGCHPQANAEKGIRLIKYASAEDSAYAAYTLGSYYAGKLGGGKPDLRVAKRHYEQAQDLGYQEAYSRVAELTFAHEREEEEETISPQARPAAAWERERDTISFIGADRGYDPEGMEKTSIYTSISKGSIPTTQLRERSEQERRLEELKRQEQQRAEREAEALRQLEEERESRRLLEARYRELEKAQQQRKSAALVPAEIAVPRPVVRDIVIPDIARGYEDIYRRFINGKLIYKPDPKSDAGKIELPIAALKNPLEGEFDLSQCGDTGKYLSINTGYRKGKRAENANKLEIWFAPRFLIEKQLTSSAKHFREIMDKWDGARAPVGIFWTWGGCDGLDRYDYLTSTSMDEIGSAELKLLGRDVLRRSSAAGGRLIPSAPSWDEVVVHAGIHRSVSFFSLN
jgi:hypothetical protein